MLDFTDSWHSDIMHQDRFIFFLFLVLIPFLLVLLAGTVFDFCHKMLVRTGPAIIFISRNLYFFLVIHRGCGLGPCFSRIKKLYVEICEN